MIKSSGQLAEMFPKNPVSPGRYPHRAITGWIPMDFFNENEPAIRSVMRENKMRVFYRGPRANKDSTMTERFRATHAVLYKRT